ncbi:MAG: polymorphic toxin-type HINT domain-containing protein, partial [Cellvibrionaceae bacterium]|nr:polymorphic toxin-type HINT domain-containing protein [Cellvibrionaceae bacterium]
QLAYQFSEMGQLLRLANGDTVTQFEYDGRQQLRKVEAGNGVNHHYAHDDFGNLVLEHSPDAGTKLHTYNPLGKRASSKHLESGLLSEFSYDAAGKLISKKIGSERISYQYLPGTNKITEISNTSATEQFAYNTMGKLTSHTRHLDGHSFTSEWQYNLQGKLIHKKLPDGQTLNYHYSDDGPVKGKLRRITRSKWFGLSEEIILDELNTYEDTATNKHWVYGNGISRELKKTGDGKVKSLRYSQSYGISYEYDIYGNISGINNNGAQERYQHNLSGELIGAETGFGSFSFNYDKNNNRTRAQASQGDAHLYQTTQGGNQLKAITDSRGNLDQYQYNSHGSTELIRKAGSDLKLEYNALQRPVKVYKNSQLIAEYGYNGFGEQIKKVRYNSKGQAKVTYYLYDGSRIVAEANGNGEIESQYLYYQGKLVGKLENKDIYAVHGDALGTPRIVTDAEQNIVWQAKYSPFGKAEVSTSDIQLNHRFPGQYYDEETGHHYNYKRDYDPGSGRYLSSDPIGQAGGLNTYAYVVNNPLALTDPIGLFFGDNEEDTERSSEKPNSEEEFTDKLEIVFDAAIEDLKDNPDGRIGAKVLENLKENAIILAGVMAVWVGAHFAGVGFVADAILAVAAIALFGYEVGRFIYNIIKLGMELNDTSICDRDALKDIGKKLSGAVIDLGAAIAESLLVAGLGKLAKLLKRAGEFVGDSYFTIARKIKKILGKKALCFVAGTLVLTPSGAMAIEELNIGDLVQSWDEKSGKVVSKPITKLFFTPGNTIWTVTLLNTDTGQEEALGTTEEHPFYVLDDGWTPASQLKPGNKVAKHSSGEGLAGFLVVKSVQLEDKQQDTFNFEVSETHNYFVGELKALVHNDCDPDELIALGGKRLDENTIIGAYGNRFTRNPDGTYSKDGPATPDELDRSGVEVRLDPDLPEVNKVVNSNAAHVVDRAIERDLGFNSRREANDKLQELKTEIKSNGWPPGTVFHKNGEDVLVPFGNGYAIYRVKGGRAEPRTAITRDQASAYSPDE